MRKEVIMVKLHEIGFEAGSKKILRNISGDFEPGKINMILGPNGSGKSSLMKIMAGNRIHHQGTVHYQDQLLSAAAIRQLARYRAVLGQQPELSFPMTVMEVVMMGRYPHFSVRPSGKDYKICHEALHKMGLEALADRNYLSLSGGEKQRVQFARVLAQLWDCPPSQHRYLFLDEPLNNLDIRYQQEFLHICRSFCNEHSTIIAIIHDINLAFQYGEEIWVLKEGELVARGVPSSVLTASLIRQVFEVEATVMQDPASGQTCMVFHSP